MNWQDGIKYWRLLDALKNGDDCIILQELGKFAALGEDYSSFDIGMTYEEELSLPRNLEMAIRWYERGAICEQDRRCYFALARIFYYGSLEVSEDLVKSFDFFKRASMLGSHEASIILVENIQRGIFPVQSEVFLQKTLRPAVRAGYVTAMRLSAAISRRNGQNLRANLLGFLAWLCEILITRRDNSDPRLYLVER